MTQTSDDLPFHTMAGHLIRRLNQQSTGIFAAKTKAAGLGLTAVQFAALDAIAAQPGLDQASLAARIAYDRATIGGVVDRLESKSYLRREISAHDRRARLLYLTDLGQTQLAQARPVIAAFQPDILSALTPQEADTLLRLIAKALGLDPDTKLDPATHPDPGPHMATSQNPTADSAP